MLLGLALIGLFFISPIFFVRLQTALKLSAAAFLGLLLWWRLTPPSEPEGMELGGVLAGLIVAGMCLAVVLRLLCAFLVYLFNREMAIRDAASASPVWLDVVFGLWASGILSLTGFVALSWQTRDLANPFLVHLILAIAAAAAFTVPVIMAAMAPLARPLHFSAGVGTGVSILVLTAYSWVWYPQMINDAIVRTVGGEPFCLFSPEARKALPQGARLTFLTLPKRNRNGHFHLVSPKKMWDWSYYLREFDSEAPSDPYWFQRFCLGESVLQ
ncbi:hypothetical protein [Roseibium sediminicola]|uniref:Uncharacterized protein n=1 Tax=Roseibium sediminicola TaxID=2933272 RepID=A0ABT0GY47_9HYPH|nr:hypothetical protein [Roseibium sp. CAU 1639]MCK7614363.1 hypothetical protein [Roseibium sp. CAU 1639]